MGFLKSWLRNVYISLQTVVVAVISTFLFSFLSLASLRHYINLTPDSRTSEDDLNIDPSFKRYNYNARIFFLVLTVSAALDVPLFVGCIITGGPEDCVYDNSSYSITWICHLLALVGYFLCLSIPLFLWSEILNGRDGYLFRLSQPNLSKTGIQCALLFYMIVIFIEVVTVFLAIDKTKPTSYLNDPVNILTRCVEAIFYAIIALLWLAAGIRLQLVMRRVVTHRDDELKVMVYVNVVMLAVASSYLLRALLIMALFSRSNDGILFSDDYFSAWVFCTRWLPYVACPFLLTSVMRLSSADGRRNNGDPDNNNNNKNHTAMSDFRSHGDRSSMNSNDSRTLSNASSQQSTHSIFNVITAAAARKATGGGGGGGAGRDINNVGAAVVTGTGGVVGGGAVGRKTVVSVPSNYSPPQFAAFSPPSPPSSSSSSSSSSHSSSPTSTSSATVSGLWKDSQFKDPWATQAAVRDIQTDTLALICLSFSFPIIDQTLKSFHFLIDDVLDCTSWKRVDMSDWAVFSFIPFLSFSRALSSSTSAP